MHEDISENENKLEAQTTSPKRSFNKKRYFVWLPLWIVVGVAFGIFVGSRFFQTSESGGYPIFIGGGGNSNKLDAIIKYIDESYVDSVNSADLIEDVIPTIISELDPHSAYISAKDMELVGDDLEGHFSGIGVQFTLRNDTINVINVISGGPSEKAGVFAGDRIVMVDDSLYAGKGITNEKVMRGLRGAAGSEVKLGIKRKGVNDLVDIVVERGDIPVNTVDISYSPQKEIGYIKISKFGATTYKEFTSAIEKLREDGCTSFIIDLRQNLGGYLNAVIQMVNEYLDKDQLIVYTEGRTSPRSESVSNGSGTSQKDQLVVLIDEGSASASEIFAGAIQDHDRGLIVGRRSFGKGLVQDQRTFKDGSALRLTIARYYTPSGRCIQKPYKLGSRDDYDQDLLNRYLRGEFDSQDSIKQSDDNKFYTDAGRLVHSGGGIMPDVFIPRDTIGINSYYLSLVNKGLVYEYAFDYTDANRKTLEKYKNWKDLDSYLSYQPLVSGLVRFAETKDVKYRPHLLNECKSLLETQLKANIIRNILGEKGFYPFINQHDVVFKRAIELLKEKEAMPSVVGKEGYKNKDQKVGKKS